MAFLLFAVTFAGFLIMFYRADGSVSLVPDDIKTVAQGQNLYKANCASCHGEKLEGQPNWKHQQQ